MVPQTNSETQADQVTAVFTGGIQINAETITQIGNQR
jgi:hypothetical protein